MLDARNIGQAPKWHWILPEWPSRNEWYARRTGSAGMVEDADGIFSIENRLNIGTGSESALQFLPSFQSIVTFSPLDQIAANFPSSNSHDAITADTLSQPRWWSNPVSPDRRARAQAHSRSHSARTPSAMSAASSSNLAAHTTGEILRLLLAPVQRLLPLTCTSVQMGSSAAGSEKKNSHYSQTSYPG